MTTLVSYWPHVGFLLPFFGEALLMRENPMPSVCCYFLLAIEQELLFCGEAQRLFNRKHPAGSWDIWIWKLHLIWMYRLDIFLRCMQEGSQVWTTYLLFVLQLWHYTTSRALECTFTRPRSFGFISLRSRYREVQLVKQRCFVRSNVDFDSFQM